MNILNHKGTALIFAIIAITLMAVLGTGIYFMTTTTTFSGLDANRQNRAYQLAVAGRDYALVKNLPNTSGSDFTFANGDKFNLVISGDTITSTGIINEGTPYEARKIITANVTGFGSRSDISFEKDIQFFTSPAETKAGLITTDTGAGQISLGKIGDEWKSQFGALWYGGSATPGNCSDGRCELGTGIRAFFVFQVSASAAGADGFTVTFFNGDTATNDFYSVGGHNGRGELLGYAGDSRIDSAGSSFLDGNKRIAVGCPGLLGCAAGRGIQPPKIAIEFDPYPNNSSGDVCNSGSRRDGNESPDQRHHAGYVFWGSNNNSSCNSPLTVGDNSYDDNRHNEGTDSASDPRNSRRPSDGVDPSYFNANAALWPYNWLTDTPNNIYAFRVEVTRSKTVNAGGNYDYIVNSWIKPCADIACSAYNDGSDFANTKVDYTADAPTMTRATPVELTPVLNNKFETFFFGWTTATGGVTQNVSVNRLRMNFKKGCAGYNAWNNLGAIGSTTYFKINGGVCTGIVRDSLIGNIGPGGTINGFTDAICTSATSPSELTYNQANMADTNIDCAVYFDGTDK